MTNNKGRQIMNNEYGKLGLLECITILIGGMIGSAIFSLSGLTMFLAGPASSLSWLIAGVIMLCYGMLVCELSCRFPKSGGVYVFPREAFEKGKGQFWGWFSCWGAILTNIVAIAFGAIYVGIYLGVAFPGMESYQIPLALFSIFLCYLLNVIKFSTAGKINNYIVALLIATIFTYVFSAFFSGNFTLQNFIPFFTQGVEGWAGVFSAVPIAVIGYSSINAMAFMVSDVKNPDSVVSKSMLISIAIVVAIYFLVIVSTMGLITTEYLIQNPGMRFIPLFAVCNAKMPSMPWLTYVVSISATIALMTTILVCISMNARTLKAASDDGILPSVFGRLNKNQVPSYAVATTCILSGIIACFPKMTSEIVNFGSLFNVFTLVITITAFIYARRTRKSEKVAFMAPGGYWLASVVLVLLAFCNFTSIATAGHEMWVFTLIFSVLGLVIFLCRKKG